MISSPIISHTDILFSIFENKELMSTFSEFQLNHLKSCIDIALQDKIIKSSDYVLIDDEV